MELRHMVEKRKHIRFTTRLPITTFFRDAEDRTFTENAVFSEDISAEGLRITYPQQLPKGTIIDLKLFLYYDPVPLSTQGKVVWSGKKKESRLAVIDNEDKEGHGLYWAGMQFININFFKRERILRWINKELTLEKI
jgi:hypothetical protein